MNENKRFLLDGQWDLSFTLPEDGKKISARITVPSNVEPTLKELGLIEDYMPADDEFAMRKFEAVNDWCYTTVFDAPTISDEWETELVFEGIDTIAEIYLNDELICNCYDMHMTHRINVTGSLKKTGNQLKVVIRSSELWARKHCHDILSVTDRETSYFNSNAHLRKARHQWGWDHAPRLLTSGIIGSVYLEALAPCRFDDVYFYTSSIDDEFVHIGASWLYQTDRMILTNHQIRLSLWDDDVMVSEIVRNVRFIQGDIRCDIPRKDVRLWWPAGAGDPNLYFVQLEMLVDGECVAVRRSKFGIRTLRLEYTPDVTSDGTGNFVFLVNGERIFARGTNWKPLSPLASVAHQKTKDCQALQELINLHCNMVRIWGGGIYEDHAFFDFCDQNGIMVWQDFMLACEIPPTDDFYCQLMEKEAIQIIKKLRNHPSLAIWCGDNENDSFYTYAKVGSPFMPSESRITREILKKAVVHYDPYRSYVESSPFVSDRVQNALNNGTKEYATSEHHLYVDPWTFSHELRQCKSYFFGEVGPFCINPIAVNPYSFEREKARTQRLWDAPFDHRTDVHQSDNYFITWRTVGKKTCLYYYGRDFSFEEWKDYTLAMNLFCAELYKEVIEYSRVTRWKKTGVLWWSLMDMWPMWFNYSVIDWQFNRKLPYYWIRQSQQEFMLSAVRVEEDGELGLYAVNDHMYAHTVQYSVTAYDENGNAQRIASGICHQNDNSSSLIQRIAEGETPQLWIIRWLDDGKEYTNHVFTKKTKYETMRLWTKIIADEMGESQSVLELKLL